MSFPVVPRGPIHTEILIWIEARNRDTGAPETMGLWTGSDDATFTIGGVARVYHGAGAVLDVPAIQSQAGLVVQMQTVGLNIITPEVAQLIRGYDARGAKTEIHLARFNPETSGLIDVSRVFKGWMDQAEIVTGPKGGSDSLTASLANSARALTRKVPLRVSDAAHQRAQPGDRIFRYADVSGTVEVFWGMKRRR